MDGGDGAWRELGLRIDRGKTGGKEVTLRGKARLAMPAFGLAPARAYSSKIQV